MIAAWSLSAALLVGYFVLGDEGDEGRPAPAQGEQSPQLPEEDRGKELIEVVEVRPGEAPPGSAVEVPFVNTYPAQTRPLRAWLSITDYRSGKQLPGTELEVLHAGDEGLVARHPHHAL